MTHSDQSEREWLPPRPYRWHVAPPEWIDYVDLLEAEVTAYRRALTEIAETDRPHGDG